MKVTIEIDGQELVVTEDMIDDGRLSLPVWFKKVPCRCPGGDCGYVHRAPTGRGRLELDLDLNTQARWT